MDQLELPMGERAVSTWRGFPWYPDRAKTRLVHCEACGRPFTDYYRKLRCSMAVGLVRLYRLHESYPSEPSFHVSQFDKLGARGEFGVLAQWALVEEARNIDPRKRTSGRWAITAFGKEFVQGAAQVPEYVILGPRSLLKGYAGNLVGIRESVEYSNRFSYVSLMRRPVEMDV